MKAVLTQRADLFTQFKEGLLFLFTNQRGKFNIVYYLYDFTKEITVINWKKALKMTTPNFKCIQLRD